MYEGDEADSVDISVENEDNHYMHQEDSGVVRQDELSISNVSEIKGDYEIRYTGEITNNSTVDLEDVCVIVIFKDGDKLLGGRTTFTDSLKSGETTAFEVNGRDDISYDNYEVYAVQW